MVRSLLERPFSSSRPPRRATRADLDPAPIRGRLPKGLPNEIDSESCTTLGNAHRALSERERENDPTATIDCHVEEEKEEASWHE